MFLFARKFIIFLTLISFCASLFVQPILARTSESSKEIPTILSEYDGYPILTPDLENLNWFSIPNLESGGNVQFPREIIKGLGYNPSRSWNKGDRPETVMMLGDIEQIFGLEQLSLDRILGVAIDKYGFEKLGELTGIDFRHLSLKDFKTISWQTVPDLLKGIPGLSQLPIGEVKPLYDFFNILADREQLDLIKSSFSVSKILRIHPEWGKISLGALKGFDLGAYDLIGSIPGLLTNPIGSFAQWGQTFISQVPGLNLLPFNFFPIPFLGGGSQVAVIAGIWSNVEQCDSSLDESWFVSGSAIDAQTIVKKCEKESSVAYAELDDLPGMFPPLFKGKRFISGEDQLVEGGTKLLKAVAGGKEPTGRLVYGKIKVKIKISESTGKVKTYLGFNFCPKYLFIEPGCTSYLFWIPWIIYNEGMLFPMGNQPVPPTIPPIPQSLPEKVEDPLIPSEDECGTSTGNFQNPVPPGVPITSHYGYRSHPINGSRRFHGGTDFGTNFGTQITASDGGIVSSLNDGCSDWGDSQSKMSCGRKGGNYIFINHENGFQTRYLHLQKYSLKVSQDQKVCPGQAIGKAGNSGSSTGPHLHFEILQRGNRLNPVHFLL